MQQVKPNSGNSWRATVSYTPLTHAKKSLVRSYDNVMDASPCGRLSVGENGYRFKNQPNRAICKECGKDSS